ncbi:MAG: hypothetical protein JEY91_09250 [Spirochaetaceae bacterium]|nr:hypothetical protein [Spirochaetaceae bacterium]
MNQLPIKNNFKTLYGLSVFLMVLTVSVSLSGLIFQDILYPTKELLSTFVPNDYVNLIIGFPLMLISLILIQKKKWIGLQIWPGALFYIIYVYLPYLISVPVNYLFIPYLLLFTISIYLLISLMASIDYSSLEEDFSLSKSVKFPAGVLISLSLLIIIRQLVLMITAITNQSLVTLQEMSLWIDDFVIASPMMILTGILLWKKKGLGYAAAPGMLLAYACLSFSLLPFLYIQSKIKNVAFDMEALIILSMMSIICIVPFVLLIRKKK